MDRVLQDVRYGVRLLVRSPGFTAAAVLTAAFGIGANSAIFSVVKAVLLAPLPYHDEERLVLLYESRRESPRISVSYPNFADWRAQSEAFDDMAAFGASRFNLTGEGEPERLIGGFTTSNFFEVLGAEPIAGRTFLPEEDRRGAARVVVLSERLWDSRFGREPGVVGRTIGVDGEPFVVIGVVGPGGRIPRSADLWITLAHSSEDLEARRSDFLGVIGRLDPGTTREGAQREMSTIAARLEQQYPDTNTGFGVQLVPLREALVGDLRTSLWVLFGAVGLVLLIACANVANLLLARAGRRRAEIDIRVALGASRGRLLAQLLTESVVLFLAGGILGLFLAAWGTDLLAAWGAGALPSNTVIRTDRTVLAFAISISLVSGIVFGLAPALQTVGPRIGRVKQSDGLSHRVSGSQRAGKALVVAEFAMALLLLAAAGLMVRSFHRLQQVNLGFDRNGLLVADLSPPAGSYPEESQKLAFYEQLLGRVNALPGVESAAASDLIPMGTGRNVLAFAIAGRPPLAPGVSQTADFHRVTPGYLRTMGIVLLEGEPLTDRNTASAPPVVLVNQSFVRRFFPGENPVGQRIRLGEDSPWITIRGVVADFRYHGLATDPRPLILAPFAQMPELPLDLSLIVRAASDPDRLVPGLRETVWALDADVPVSIIGMEQLVSGSLAREELNLLLLGLFGALALTLASIGIYGVMAHAVGARMREIGIRMALGAEPRGVLGDTLAQALRLLGLGLALGIGGALAVSRILQGLLYQVSATDPLTLGAVSLLLSAVALLASYVPARRAARIDPATALRYE